ncbi:hypothetical protein ASE63_19660 [Bosea sp. Root381]|nr:hypothetical protein ASE63_19660 [Bosea sp. Root381]
MAQGLMTIEGVATRFAQGLGRHLRLSAENLQLVGGFASREGRIENAARILGRASLSGDSLHRAGAAGEARDISLTVRPFAGSEDGRILLLLGFREGEGEESGFFAEIYAPSMVFEALKRDILSGAAQVLSLSAMTSLWVRENEREAVPGMPVAWHLGLEADGRNSAPARGLIETLDWRGAAPAVAPHQDDSVSPLDEAADQLGRINWSLKLIALVLVLLLLVVALK